ncbi:MAG: phosphate/phosphite/phosphonate ABC transporter substrate-binding protein [Proteobacteria bacterium]|nr:phosphate/phosphite/phosphonate ABC transporter substrate-binding protein [Pseudomonadota bacterium]MBU4469987.1 phosphate/phosphite/phosphonate ABC transporter substrate-binding protein [Pseudomonadota bacterium]MCG2753750.1 phosphate/phosphite/phosphonate ABC transporter substrate-binding protein [Desulfobacteraceae bacterium]
MKRFLSLLCLLCIVGTADAQPADNPNTIPFRIGISSHTMGNVNRNDYMAAFKTWAATVGREQGLAMRVEAEVFEEMNNLGNAFRDDRLDGLILGAKDLMDMGMKPEAVLLSCGEEGLYVHYAIVVHRDSSIKDADGLMGRKVVTNNGHLMGLARSWYEVLLTGHTGGADTKRPGNLIMRENPAKCILQVFFQQADAALVTEDSFNLACELNPQLRKDCKILSVSPPFIPGLFIIRPGFKEREKLETAIEELHKSPGGQQILSIFQGSRMEKHPGSIMEPTLQFLGGQRQELPNSSPQGARP